MELVIQEQELKLEIGDIVIIKGKAHLIVKTISIPDDAYRLINIKSCISVATGYTNLEALTYYIKKLDSNATIYKKDRVKMIIE